MKKVVFMGTPKFASDILLSLVSNELIEIVLVVTQPDKPVGRKKLLIPGEVKQVALSNNLKLFQPIKIKIDYQEILDCHPDIIITAAYGQIIPNIVLDCTKLLPINVHGSLLPKYRGGAPVHLSVINGDEMTGVTIMQMVSKMDAGDIISQELIPIGINDTTAIVFEKMTIVAINLLQKTLVDIFNGTYTLTKQQENLVTYAPNISKTDELITFNKKALIVHNKIRGLNNFPIGYTIINGIRVKIFMSELTNIRAGKTCTINKITSEGIFINCEDYVIKILEIQIAGKKKLSIQEYLNGKINIHENDYVSGGLCD